MWTLQGALGVGTGSAVPGDALDKKGAAGSMSSSCMRMV